jgi:hypothetical protein
MLSQLQYRKVMKNAAAQHKQVPDNVVVWKFAPPVKNDSSRVEDVH